MRWHMVSRVMVNVGATVQAKSMIYKAVMHTVLLYGSESLVITDAMIIFWKGYTIESIGGS